MTNEFDWAEEFPSAITVCDTNAIILYMNNKSLSTFAGDGGAKLIGTSLFDCHNPASCAMIKELIATGSKNSYTIEKNGVKKIIHQSPWYKAGEIAGLVEISIEIPFEMAHHIRG